MLGDPDLLVPWLCWSCPFSKEILGHRQITNRKILGGKNHLSIDILHFGGTHKLPIGKCEEPQSSLPKISWNFAAAADADADADAAAASAAACACADACADADSGAAGAGAVASAHYQ